MSVNVGTAVAYLELDMTAFNAGLAQAQSALQTFGDANSSLSSKVTAVGGAIANTGSALTRTFTVPIVNAGQSIIDFGATFDKSMSNVKSVMQPTREEFEELRKSAMDWGGKTVYTADEAAQALYYMGLAGWETEESISALGGVLNLAAAGQLDLGQTSDIVTDSMTALHLSADGVSEGINSADWYVNLLASTMANSNTTVDKLGESFKYVASAVGGIESPMYSAEEAARDTAFALGILANNGIKSSQAGTTLRRVILNLEKPSETVKAGMEGLNIALEDVDFTTNGLKGVIDTFRSSVRNLLPYLDEEQLAHLQVAEGVSEEEAQMQLYNQTMDLVQQGVIDTTQQQVLMNIAQVSGAYAVAGLTSLVMTEQESYDDLYNTLLNSNAEFVRHGDEIYTISEAYSLWGDEIYNNSEQFEILGAAEGMAEVQMDNLQGSWVRFTSALDTTKILLSDLVKDQLRSFVDRLTELVEWFNKLDKETQMSILKWGAFAAALGPVLLVLGHLITAVGHTFGAIETIVGIVGRLISSVAEAHGVLGLLGQQFSSVGSFISGFGLQAAGIIAIIAAVAMAIYDLWQTNEEFRDNVKRILTALVDIVKRVWDIVKPILDFAIDLIKMLAKVLEPIIEVLAAILAPVMELLAEVLGTVADLLSPILNFVEALISPIQYVAQLLELLAPIAKTVAEVVLDIFTALASIVDLIAEAIGWFVDWFSNGVKDAIKETFDWIQEMIDKFVDWWNNLGFVKAIKGAFSGIKDTFNVISGSHAYGLEYVPFDGYIAELHKGERVLTAEQNKEYSNNSSGGNTVINFYSNERIDEYTAAKELRRVTKDIELGLV